MATHPLYMWLSSNDSSYVNVQYSLRDADRCLLSVGHPSREDYDGRGRFGPLD